MLFNKRYITTAIFNNFIINLDLYSKIFKKFTAILHSSLSYILKIK